LAGVVLGAAVVSVVANGPLAAAATQLQEHGVSTGDQGVEGSTAVLDASRAAPSNSGYWLEAADGGVFAFGAPFLGSATQRCDLDCFGFGATASGQGYWIVNPSATRTDLYGFGDGPNISFQTPPLSESGPFTAVAPSASGKGGWVLYEDTGVVAPFGDAKWFGDGTGIAGCCREWPPFGTNIPYFAGIASTPDGGGYWLVGIDGGVFAFGDASFYGSMGGKPLNAPVSGIARSNDGHGYWLVAVDGGVFSFGDAAFHGSMGGKPLNEEMVGITASPDGRGYWTAAMDGGVFAFGDAPFLGSMAGHPLAHWIDGIATSR
jgi:hypothetical protein